jgi:hypothetical protein
MKCTEIELFKNLAQYDWSGKYYDFHNDFYCSEVKFENDNLILNFISFNNSLNVLMHFKDVSIIKFEINSLQEKQKLAIDNIYRGRFEKFGNLLEFSNDGKSYFYLEFYEGVKMEFFSNEVFVR